MILDSSFLVGTFRFVPFRFRSFRFVLYFPIIRSLALNHEGDSKTELSFVL